MKTITKALLAVTLGANMFGASLAYAQTGNDGGNGGGGVIENGQYMTFYSAGMMVNPIPKGLDSTPVLNKLINFLTRSTALGTVTKMKVLQALLPSQDRNYFDVRADKFGPDIQERLKNEYVRATSATTDRIVLYAVTDTNAKNTYLLPSFYRLSESGQMAILFHEAMWILNPKSTYQQIITAEATLQAFVEHPNDFTSAQRFVRLVGTPSDEARFAYEWDRAHGVITADGRVVEGPNSVVLSLNTLLGSAAASVEDVRSLDEFSQKLFYFHGREAELLKLTKVQTIAINLSIAFPHSRFLEFYRDASMKGHLSFRSDCPELYRDGDGLHLDRFEAGYLAIRSPNPAEVVTNDGFALKATLNTNMNAVIYRGYTPRGTKTVKANATASLTFE